MTEWNGAELNSINAWMNAWMQWNGTEQNGIEWTDKWMHEWRNEGQNRPTWYHFHSFPFSVNINELSLFFRWHLSANAILPCMKRVLATQFSSSCKIHQKVPSPWAPSQAPACHESPRPSWPLLVVLEPPGLNVSLAAQAETKALGQTNKKWANLKSAIIVYVRWHVYNW